MLNLSLLRKGAFKPFLPCCFLTHSPLPRAAIWCPGQRCHDAMQHCNVTSGYFYRKRRLLHWLVAAHLNLVAAHFLTHSAAVLTHSGRGWSKCALTLHSLALRVNHPTPICYTSGKRHCHLTKFGVQGAQDARSPGSLSSTTGQLCLIFPLPSNQ